MLLEEYGHYVDSEINVTDAAGDEGNIFASLVQGIELNQQQLQALKQENDSAVINLDGNLIQIEQQAYIGGSGNDRIYAGDGNDDVYGHGGHDELHGGGGNDTLHGWVGNDTLIGNWGDDTFFGQEDNDIIYGGDGNDRAWGGNGNDRAWGGNGNDLAWGGNGNDRAWGGNGNDLAWGDGGEDTLYGEGGNDRAWGGNGNDHLNGWTGEDTLYGEGGNDSLIGESQDDILKGGEGDDTLVGGEGNDLLAGGTGTNINNGGPGSDIFAANSGGNQIIVDFSKASGDKIDVTTHNTATTLIFAQDGNDDFIRIDGFERIRTQGVNDIDQNDLEHLRGDSDASYFLLNPEEENDLFPTLDLSNGKIKEIIPLIEDWVEKFALSQGTTFNDKISLENVKIRLNHVGLPQDPITIPAQGSQTIGLWRNSTSSTGSLSITQSNSTTIETTTTVEESSGSVLTSGSDIGRGFSRENATESHWYAEGTIGASASVEVGTGDFLPGGNATVGASVSLTAGGGGSETTVNTSSGTTSQHWENVAEASTTNTTIESYRETEGGDITVNTEIQPQSTFKIISTTYEGVSANVPIVMKYSLSGDINFGLNNEEYNVPINAILQYYDLEDDDEINVFTTNENSRLLGTNFDGNNYSIYYPEFVDFEIHGNIKMDSIIVQTETEEVIDVLLNGSINNGTVEEGFDNIEDTSGNITQVKYTANIVSERLWIIKDSLTSNILYDDIIGFSPNDDKIGIAHDLIDAFNDLDISYSDGNADIYFDNQHLAKIRGVDKNSLSASDFLFSTANTIFDDSVQDV